MFYNPYAALELENGPVGPDQCEGCPGAKGHWLDGLFYPGAGDYAFDRNGNRVLLSRDDRRELQRREKLIGDQVEVIRKVAEFNARQAAMPDRPLPHPLAAPTAISAPTAPTEAGSTTPISRGAAADDREMPR